MKVALIGATGWVGSAVLQELLDRGHEVTAIARNVDKLSAHPRLHAVRGNILDPEQVAVLVKGNDAVVSSYNPGWTNPAIYGEFLQGSQAIQEGVKKAGIKRVLFIGGAGSLEITPGLQLIDTPEFPEAYKPGASAARDYLNIIRKEKELDWTYLSPAILMHPGMEGSRKGHYRTGLDTPVFDEKGQSVISPQDLALVIVDELEHPRHIRQRFTAGY